MEEEVSSDTYSSSLADDQRTDVKLGQLSDDDLRQLVRDIFNDEAIKAEEQQTMRFLERIETERTQRRR